MGKLDTNARATRHIFASYPHFPYRLRIGIMGGSFNPAHSGHLYIAELAKKSANLDEVWLIVSPQNPLKSTLDTADFKTRLDQIKTIAGRRRWLRCLSLEQDKQLNRTADTLAYINKICRSAQFVWIMGADNLIQFPRWKQFQSIPELMPVMVINRPSYHYRSLASYGAKTLGLYRKNPRQMVSDQKGWSFIHHANNRLSSTALRRPLRCDEN